MLTGMAAAKWVYDAGIPFHALEHPSFKKFMKAAQLSAPSYGRVPPGRNLSGVFLDEHYALTWERVNEVINRDKSRPWAAPSPVMV